MKFSLFIVAVLACQAYAAPSDSSIVKTLQGQKTATVIVDVVGSDLAAIRRQVASQSFATRAHKINALYDALKNHADSKQQNVLALLNKEQEKSPIVVEQLWISNQIIVKNADLATVEKLLAMDEVKSVRQEQVFPLEQPIELIVHPDGTVPQAGEQWGVVAINAPQVHATGNKGGKAVIGSIDTGVRATHEALRDGLRATHNWLDPYSKTATPNDQNGHGTHTMGTIAGRANGVGVAPETTWISCKGCSSSGCTEAALLSCGQFMACPTNPQGGEKDCSKAPNAVSNSWGGGQGNTFYDNIIATWVAAEIAPLFSNGNSGPYCGSANSPADGVEAIGVGSTTSADGLSDFSSVGPTYRGNRIKPDIAAPGSAVVSSYYLSDTSYSTMSGTSMACPHVAGMSALLYNEKPNLTVAGLRAALESGAQPISKTTGSCDGIPATTYPNHYVGHGRIDAVQSLNIVKAL